MNNSPGEMPVKVNCVLFLFLCSPFLHWFQRTDCPISFFYSLIFPAYPVFYFLTIYLCGIPFSHSFPAMNEDHEFYDLCTAECVVESCFFFISSFSCDNTCASPGRVKATMSHSSFNRSQYLLFWVPRKLASDQGGVLRLLRIVRPCLYSFYAYHLKVSLSLECILDVNSQVWRPPMPDPGSPDRSPST
jgi:hypothetical protein